MTTTEKFSEALLEPREAAAFLKLSLSWLAKARQRREGPPYIKLGRSVRYNPSALSEWLQAHQR
jgi:predicted DNA-binding transcriptional regulator AlpA